MEGVFADILENKIGEAKYQSTIGLICVLPPLLVVLGLAIYLIDKKLDSGLAKRIKDNYDELWSLHS